MIRINLLPVRAAKRKESFRVQLVAAGAITFLVVGLTMMLYFSAQSEAGLISGEIATIERELAMLKKKIGELARIKQEKKVLEDKIRVVKQLEEGKTGPVELFTRISEAIPKKAWLTTLKDMGKVVAINGYAKSDDTLADFMRELEKKKVGVVDLEVATRKMATRGRGEAVEFRLKVQKGVNGAKAKKAKKGKKR